ncbi:MAG: hypothetical protein ABIT58_05650 [Ferruginibacter sp.]
MDQKKSSICCGQMTEGRGPGLFVDAVAFGPKRSINDRVKAVFNLKKEYVKVLEA